MEGSPPYPLESDVWRTGRDARGEAPRPVGTRRSGQQLSHLASGVLQAEARALSQASEREAGGSVPAPAKASGSSEKKEIEATSERDTQPLDACPVAHEIPIQHQGTCRDTSPRVSQRRAAQGDAAAEKAAERAAWGGESPAGAGGCRVDFRPPQDALPKGGSSPAQERKREKANDIEIAHSAAARATRRRSPQGMRPKKKTRTSRAVAQTKCPSVPRGDRADTPLTPAPSRPAAGSPTPHLDAAPPSAPPPSSASPLPSSAASAPPPSSPYPSPLRPPLLASFLCAEVKQASTERSCAAEESEAPRMTSNEVAEGVRTGNQALLQSREEELASAAGRGGGEQRLKSRVQASDGAMCAPERKRRRKGSETQPHASHRVRGAPSSPSALCASPCPLLRHATRPPGSERVLFQHIVCAVLQPLNRALGAWRASCIERQLRDYAECGTAVRRGALENRENAITRRTTGWRTAAPEGDEVSRKSESPEKADETSAEGRRDGDGDDELFPDAPGLPISQLSEAYSLIWSVSVADPRACLGAYGLFCALLYVFAHQRLRQCPALDRLLRRLYLPPSKTSSSSSSEAPPSSLVSARSEPAWSAPRPAAPSAPPSLSAAALPLDSSPPCSPAHEAPAPAEFLIRVVGVWREYLHFAYALLGIFSCLQTDTASPFLRTASHAALRPPVSPFQHVPPRDLKESCRRVQLPRPRAETREPAAEPSHAEASAAALPTSRVSSASCARELSSFGDSKSEAQPASGAAASHCTHRPRAGGSLRAAALAEDFAPLREDGKGDCEGRGAEGKLEEFEGCFASGREAQSAESDREAEGECKPQNRDFSSCGENAGGDSELPNASLSPTAVGALVLQHLCSPDLPPCMQKQSEKNETSTGREGATEDEEETCRSRVFQLQKDLPGSVRNDIVSKVSLGALVASTMAMQEAALPLDVAALRIFRTLLSPACLTAFRAAVSFCLKEKRTCALRAVLLRCRPPPPACRSLPSAPSSPASSIPPSSSESPSSTRVSSRSAASLHAGAAAALSPGARSESPGRSAARREPTRRQTACAEEAAASSAPSPGAAGGGMHPRLLREAVVFLRRVCDSDSVRLLSLPAWEREKKREAATRAQLRAKDRHAAPASAFGRPQKTPESRRDATTPDRLGGGIAGGGGSGEPEARHAREKQNPRDARGHAADERERRGDPDRGETSQRASGPSAVAAAVPRLQRETGDGGVHASPPQKATRPPPQPPAEAENSERRARRVVAWGTPQWIAGASAKSVWDGDVKEAEKFRRWLMQKAGKFYMTTAACLLRQRSLPLQAYVQLGLHLLEAEAALAETCLPPQAREDMLNAAASALFRFHVETVLQLPPRLGSLLKLGDWLTVRSLFATLRRWPKDALLRFVAECRMHWQERFSFVFLSTSCADSPPSSSPLSRPSQTPYPTSAKRADPLSALSSCPVSPSDSAAARSLPSTSNSAAASTHGARTSEGPRSSSQRASAALSASVAAPARAATGAACVPGGLPSSFLVRRLSALVKECSATEGELKTHFGNHPALRKARDEAFEAVLNGEDVLKLFSAYQARLTSYATPFSAPAPLRHSSSSCLCSPHVCAELAPNVHNQQTGSSLIAASPACRSDADGSAPERVFLQSPSFSFSALTLLCFSLRPSSSLSRSSSLLLSAAVVDYVAQVLQGADSAGYACTPEADPERVDSGCFQTEEGEAIATDACSQKRRRCGGQMTWLASMRQVLHHMQERDTFCNFFRLSVARRLLATALLDFRAQREIPSCLPEAAFSSASASGSRPQAATPSPLTAAASREAEDSFAAFSSGDKSPQSGNSETTRTAAHHPGSLHAARSRGHPLPPQQRHHDGRGSSGGGPREEEQGTVEAEARFGGRHERAETGGGRQEISRAGDQGDSGSASVKNEHERREPPFFQQQMAQAASSASPAFFLSVSARTPDAPSAPATATPRRDAQLALSPYVLRGISAASESVRQLQGRVNPAAQSTGRSRGASAVLIDEEARLAAGHRDAEPSKQARLKLERCAAREMLEAAVGEGCRQQEAWKLRQIFEDLDAAESVEAEFAWSCRERYDLHTGRETSPLGVSLHSGDAACLWADGGTDAGAWGGSTESEAAEKETDERSTIAPSVSQHAWEDDPRSAAKQGVEGRGVPGSLPASDVASRSAVSDRVEATRPAFERGRSHFIFHPLILTQHAWTHALPHRDLYLAPRTTSSAAACLNSRAFSAASPPPAHSPPLLTPAASLHQAAASPSSAYCDVPRPPSAEAEVASRVGEFTERVYSLRSTSRQKSGFSPSRQSGLHARGGRILNASSLKGASAAEDAESELTRYTTGRSLSIRLMKIGDAWVPRDLGMPLKAFTAFYRSRFPERRLSWQLRLSRLEVSCLSAAEATAFIAARGRPRPTLRVNLPALAGVILLLFNARPLFSLREISESTGLSRADAAKIVLSLLVASQQLLQLLPIAFQGRSEAAQRCRAASGDSAASGAATAACGEASKPTAGGEGGEESGADACEGAPNQDRTTLGEKEAKRWDESKSRLPLPCDPLARLWRELTGNEDDCRICLNEAFFAPREEETVVHAHPLEDAALALFVPDIAEKAFLAGDPLYEPLSSLFPSCPPVASPVSPPLPDGYPWRVDSARETGSTGGTRVDFQVSSSLRVSADYQALVEAAVVRVMKRYRRLPHARLYQEVQSYIHRRLSAQSSHMATASRESAGGFLEKQKGTDASAAAVTSRETGEVPRSSCGVATQGLKPEEEGTSKALPPPKPTLSAERGALQEERVETPEEEIVAEANAADRTSGDTATASLLQSRRCGGLKGRLAREHAAAEANPNTTRTSDGELGGESCPAGGDAERSARHRAGGRQAVKLQMEQKELPRQAGLDAKMEAVSPHREGKEIKKAGSLGERALVPMALFKKRLDSLLEREFIARDGNDSAVYIYLP
ncbi:hypothetical protein BESB_068640 [Besnoitia besnoiti]|uniref:Cullin family profile domain-containing protein n=1 Tax=Besnoitia besnoiti TaxID=94643 RepID=A0A2A9MEZ3_BESBE|nr:hypothetical protein BESB_068640 [Besnoitia besnoiti]PFH34831.1 hypothetical protein BESB_068640 [Besnoitia besnoiti]